MCVRACVRVCVCVCVCVRVSTSTWWAWKHVAGFLHVGILVVLLFQPVFSMADACSVANNSLFAHDCVVDTSSGQGSSQVGVAISPVHQKAYKWCKAFCVCVCACEWKIPGLIPGMVTGGPGGLVPTGEGAHPTLTTGYLV